MQYKQNEIPECPHCGEKIDCDIGDGTSPGVQHIALHDCGDAVGVECEYCYEGFTVTTLTTGELYEVD